MVALGTGERHFTVGDDRDDDAASAAAAAADGGGAVVPTTRGGGGAAAAGGAAGGGGADGGQKNRVCVYQMERTDEAGTGHSSGADEATWSAA
jgi:hypothetical protein